MVRSAGRDSDLLAEGPEPADPESYAELIVEAADTADAGGQRETENGDDESKETQ